MFMNYQNDMRCATYSMKWKEEQAYQLPVSIRKKPADCRKTGNETWNRISSTYDTQQKQKV